MRIGVDVMGGDNAPDEILKGCFLALDRLAADDEIYLIGDRSCIEDALVERAIRDDRIRTVFTTEVIGMDESPVDAVRNKEDSSITVMTRMAGPGAKGDRLDGVVSAGNTGACIAAAQMYMRRLPNVIRPGIAVTVPTFAGPVVLIDVGANIEPKPAHLAQYGIMGDLYARQILGIKSPRVALMNVGGEAGKGTGEMKEARELLERESDIRFTGYVEGRGVFNGEADVVITDGVVGNVMIKLAEGLSAGIFRALVRETLEIDPQLVPRLDPVINSLYRKHDYHEYGGAPLLGVNGVCLISHGSSVARTITNAVVRAKQFVASGINDEMVRRLATSGQPQA
ncbi:MAG: phosphate acyltransferase PlsX [Planctomycetota bacterium]|nr:phosphate acyltransferase PlsX [Planctomycetota bacterium]